MLLKEVRVLTDLQVISESRDTGIMCIRGTFQRAEEENHNKRVYPKAVLESCVKSLQEKLNGRELVGELDHPADGVVKLQNASHLITKLEWKGNDLIGEAEILPTPAGQIAKSLINAGVKIGISSRGMGTLSEASEGSKIVNPDYKMITFDLVADPSTKGAYPSLAESRQHALDFVENVIKPAISEKAFVARLKKKLDEAKKPNPWAICHASVGPEKSDKFERCVKKVKKREGIKLDEMCGPKKHGRNNNMKSKTKILRKKITKESKTPLTLSKLNEGLASLATRAVTGIPRRMGREQWGRKAGGLLGKAAGGVAGGILGGLGGAVIGRGRKGMQLGSSFGSKLGGGAGQALGGVADSGAKVAAEELGTMPNDVARKFDTWAGDKAMGALGRLKGRVNRGIAKVVGPPKPKVS